MSIYELDSILENKLKTAQWEELNHSEQMAAQVLWLTFGSEADEHLSPAITRYFLERSHAS